MTISVDTISAAIMSGEMDSRLEDIKFAMAQRKEFLKRNMMRQLVPGDTVRVDNIRPKAICGLTAEVKKVNRTTLTVEFGPEAGRYAGSCRVPASCCERV
jgi:hypothetical protein